MTRPAPKPMSAADPRPGNKPHYIDSACPGCGTPLVLADRLRNLHVRENKIWHDEWQCPQCRDGIYMDWPKECREELLKSAQDPVEYVSVEELKKKLLDADDEEV